MTATLVRTRLAVPAILIAIAALLAAACNGGTGTPSPTAGSSQPSRTPGTGSSSGVPSAPTGTDQKPVDFKTGKASLTLTGSERATVELGEIVPSEDGSIFSGFDPVEGTSVNWREAGKQKGWYLTLQGFFGQGVIKTAEPVPFVSLTSPDDRSVQDMAGACTVDVATSTREEFEGTISCIGLRWLDEEDEPTGDPFDAKASFTAAP